MEPAGDTRLSILPKPSDLLLEAVVPDEVLVPTRGFCAFCKSDKFHRSSEILSGTLAITALVLLILGFLNVITLPGEVYALLGVVLLLGTQNAFAQHKIIELGGFARQTDLYSAQNSRLKDAVDRLDPIAKRLQTEVDRLRPIATQLSEQVSGLTRERARLHEENETFKHALKSFTGHLGEQRSIIDREAALQKKAEEMQAREEALLVRLHSEVSRLEKMIQKKVEVIKRVGILELVPALLGRRVHLKLIEILRRTQRDEAVDALLARATQEVRETMITMGRK